VPETTQGGDLIKRYWPGISWALLIFVLSSISPPSLRIPRLFDLFEPDKVGHFVFYAILFLLLARGARQGENSVEVRPAIRRSVFIITVAYGGLIELYQGYLLTDRVADWVDFMANVIGAGIGAILTRFAWFQRNV